MLAAFTVPSAVVPVTTSPLACARSVPTCADHGAQETGSSLAFSAFVGTVCASQCVLRGRRRRRLSNRSNICRNALDNWPSKYVAAGNAVEALQKVQWPASWPYTDSDFRRQDERDDEDFYSQPRLCTHVDDNFINALRNHYAKVFPTYTNPRILDICSSWISHYPEQKCWSHVSITGMNDYELKNNKQADDYKVRNLNITPELPYDSESFDIVTCTVSMDYLNKPLEVMKEVARVLKPGGMVILSTSNRCFSSKAISLWLQTNDTEHVLIYGSYMHYTGKFEAPECLNLGGPLANVGFADPVYVIQARKK